MIVLDRGCIGFNARHDRYPWSWRGRFAYRKGVEVGCDTEQEDFVYIRPRNRLSVFESRGRRFVTSGVINHAQGQPASHVQFDGRGKHTKPWEPERFESDADGV